MAGITLSQSLLKGLACAALNPGLRAILVFDAPYDALTAMASALAQLLRTTTGKEVRSVQLGTSELDDDLWGRLAISTNESGNQAVRWHQGLLTASLDDPSLSLIIIPSLTRLSLAATRACVMTVGADIVDLERNGQQVQWRPEICWLATCPTAQVGALSSHLLDRFSLRLHWEDAGARLTVRDAHWLQQILKDIPSVGASDYILPPGLIEQVQRAAQQHTMLTEEARDSILAHFAMHELTSMRREIALARLASAVAQLDGASTITIDHVAAAAEMIGLRAIRRSREEQPPLEDLQAQTSQLNEPNVPSIEQPQLPIEPRPSSPPSKAMLYQATEQVYESGQPVEQQQHAILLPIQPYPEDTAPVEREVASLQLPLLPYSGARSDQGIVIGVEPTDTLHDLAVVSTILAAAPYQRIRREQLEQRQQALSQEARPILQQQKKSAGDKHHDSSFLLARSDLRRYRRAPATDLMLLILLDYTSLRDRNWRESLLPYLIRAYVERASIAIVQVGMKGAVHELRAEVVSARSIRAPGIDDALVDAYGRATPLAHGFDLALQTLRHALQHGRNTSHHALLVIISDGRGNVPLEGSRTGCISQPVGRNGIFDALQIAQEIRYLKEVEKVLLNPQPELYADLPLLLAEAVGAVVEDIPRLDGGGMH